MTAAPVATSPEPTVTLGWSDRLLPVLLLGSIGVGLAVGTVVPSIGRSLSSLASIGVFALIYLVMLDVGTSGLAHVFAERKFLATAVVLNFVVNPVLAWILGGVFLPGSPELRVGLILFLVTPCIGWYLVFTQMAGGDTELGISLLGVNIVLQVLLLPLYLVVFVGDAAPVPASTIVGSVAVYLAAPAVLAAITRHIGRRRRDGIGAPVSSSTLKTSALAIVIISMFASQTQTIFENPDIVLRLLVPITGFFVIAFAIALVVGRRAGMTQSHTTLLAFTTTSRNSEASLAIAATAFSSPLVALTVVLGPVIELPLLVVMVRILHRVTPREPTQRQKMN